MSGKRLLKALIAALVPVLYSLLKAHYPDFPLESDQVLALILWIVGLLIGGWQLAKFHEEIRRYTK